ncbi:MAG: type II toxin-antitoxin system HicA family toxin [Bacteroidota bacterium]
MSKLRRLTAKEAEALLFAAGFELARTKGSHRIYMFRTIRVVVPFHSGTTLHPKIIKQILEAIDQAKSF